MKDRTSRWTFKHVESHITCNSQFPAHESGSIPSFPRISTKEKKNWLDFIEHIPEFSFALDSVSILIFLQLNHDLIQYIFS